MAKCKCKFPSMEHIEGQGFKCTFCGLWVIKVRKHWLKTKIAELHKKEYNRKKEKKIEEE